MYSFFYTNRTSLVKLSSLLVLVVISGVGCFSGSSKKKSFDLSVLESVDNIVPILIIGSGPAGYSAAIYAAPEYETYVIQGNDPGGLLNKTTGVDNWPGDVSVQGPELVRRWQEHAARRGAVLLDDSVNSIDLSRWPYTVTTDNDRKLHACTIIICTGSIPRKLGVPGEEQYWGHGVTACAICDAPFFKGEDVVVVGGGNSAVEQAIQLSTHVNSITILVRSDKMRASRDVVERIKEYPSISIRYNVRVKEIQGNGSAVTGVALVDSTGEDKGVFPTAGVFLAIGHDPNTSWLPAAIHRDEHGSILPIGRTQATAIPGIFVAGDVEDNRYRQASVSSGRGSAAGIDAYRFLQEIGFDPATRKRYNPRLFRNTLSEQDESSQGAPQPNQNTVTTSPVSPVAATASNMIVITSKGMLDELVEQAELPVIVDFFAYECPPCMKMLPAMEAAARKYQGKVQFMKVNVGEVSLVAEAYGVTSLPDVLIFNQGTLIGRVTKKILDASAIDAMVSQLVEG